MNSPSWANGSLCSARSVRLFTTSPRESMNQQRARASASHNPSWTIATTKRFAMPVPASPAPQKTHRCSFKGHLVTRKAE
jgi:hypothetical protein